MSKKDEKMEQCACDKAAGFQAKKTWPLSSERLIIKLIGLLKISVCSMHACICVSVTILLKNNHSLYNSLYRVLVLQRIPSDIKTYLQNSGDCYTKYSRKYLYIS